MDTIESLFEKAVRLLCNHIPKASELTKPTLFHSIRVGTYLYTNQYSKDIVLAGALHDIIEDTDISEQFIVNEFGKGVLKLILANTKNTSILNSNDRIEELIKRCVENGEEALIIKAADVIDNFTYFSRTSNQKGVDYCTTNAKEIFTHKPDNFNNQIFEKLKTRLGKTIK